MTGAMLLPSAVFVANACVASVLQPAISDCIAEAKDAALTEVNGIPRGRVPLPAGENLPPYAGGKFALPDPLVLFITGAGKCHYVCVVGTAPLQRHPTVPIPTSVATVGRPIPTSVSLVLRSAAIVLTVRL